MSAYDNLSILGSLLPECCRPYGLAGRLIRRNMRRKAAVYRGGLPAEMQSRRVLHRNAKQEMRRSYLRERGGRRIDLLTLLKCRIDSPGEDLPRWALADPAKSLDDYNGRVSELPGTAYGARYHVDRRSIDVPAADQNTISTVVPAGIPPLPPIARRLVTDRLIRRRARWVGLLWQPDEWSTITPDPAIIVEWKDLPGEYYCLAVWGHDGPAITEFYL